MNKNPHLILIDDDKRFLEVFALSLSSAFYVSTFSEPATAVKYMHEHKADGVLLDYHLGEFDGPEVCHQIQSLHKNLPVFFLSSDGDINRILDSLSVGGIDFFHKTMPINEIIVRINARLKNLKSGMPVASLLKCGNMVIDTTSRTVTIDQKTVLFTPKEYDILKFFMGNKNIVFTKEDLMGKLWPGIKVDSNNLDTHLFHMRKKLSASTCYINTLKGVGYIMKTDHSRSS